jgi:hypothetical protein
MTFDHVPQSLAERCVQQVHRVQDIEEWAEICTEATILEGAGPMLEAARLRMPLGHHPDVRLVMRSAASARLEFLRLMRTI